MVRTSENGDFIGKNSDFGGKYYTIHSNSQEVWYQTVPCKYKYSTYTEHCKYKYENKHSILKIQIQLQYSGKWQEVWSSSYHALANSTRHSVSSKTKYIQSRFFLLQRLHKIVYGFWKQKLCILTKKQVLILGQTYTISSPREAMIYDK